MCFDLVTMAGAHWQLDDLHGTPPAVFWSTVFCNQLYNSYLLSNDSLTYQINRIFCSASCWQQWIGTGHYHCGIIVLVIWFMYFLYA